MGKRSDFRRRPQDAYYTPNSAVWPLLPFLHGVRTFAEPCCGDGRLATFLNAQGFQSVYVGDIQEGRDAFKWSGEGSPDAIITNPPWTRPILHEMIEHFQSIAPTWLLFDADWAHTKQAAPFLPHCSDIVSVGRVKWIEDSPYTGKDNCAWYRFEKAHVTGPRFHGQRISEAA